MKIQGVKKTLSIKLQLQIYPFVIIATHAAVHIEIFPAGPLRRKKFFECFQGQWFIYSYLVILQNTFILKPGSIRTAAENNAGIEILTLVGVTMLFLFTAFHSMVSFQAVN